MTILVTGLVLFLGIHSIAIVAPQVRVRAVAALGGNAWQGLYSLLSVAGFALILYGFHRARQAPVALYLPPSWGRQAALVLMVPVFPLILAAYFPGRIKAAMQHPMLLAVMLWALAHLLSNGTLADVLLFGLFLLWAVLDRISFSWRPPQVIRTAPPARANDLIAVLAGLALYAVFLGWAHRWLFTVSPMG